MLVTNCDRVLIDSGMYYFDNNMESKKSNIGKKNFDFYKKVY